MGFPALPQRVQQIQYHYQRANLPGAATELAFNLIFALIPLLLFLAALLGRVVDAQFSLYEIKKAIWLAVPSGMAHPIIEATTTFVENSGSWPLLGGIFVAVIWTISNCGAVLLTTVSRLKGEKQPIHLLKLRGKALTMFGLIALGLVGTFVLLGVVYIVLSGLMPFLINGETGPWWEQYLPIRWLLGLLVAPALFGWIYWAIYSLVHLNAPKLECLKAGLLFYAGWSVVVWGFGLYIEHISTLDAVYGPLSTLFIFLTWSNLTAQLFMLGLVIAGTQVLHPEQK